MSQAGVIDGLQFARGELEQRGSLGIQDMPRLAQMNCRADRLEYVLKGGVSGDGKPFLRISVSGELRLTCQRCLGLLAFPMAFEVELQLTESLREIETAEDDLDRVLAAKAMDVARLVEDEVILALPMAPRHERCVSTGAAAMKKESPFGALAALKRGDKGH